MNLLEKLDQESDVVDELRNHLELVLEGFLAGPLSSAPISKLVTDPGYEELVDEFRPKLNEAFVSFLSALLYALKTSLIDVELIDRRAYDLSAAHDHLKNLINSLKSAVDIWLRKLPEKPKLVAREQDVDKASLTYENSLAMSCVNKVLTSSLSKNEKAMALNTKLGEGDYSYESSTTLTVFCDGDHDDWHISKVEMQGQSKKHAEENRLKPFSAGACGGVPFPEYGVDIVDYNWRGPDSLERTKRTSDVTDHQNPAAVPMMTTEWEDNWLFRRKSVARMEAFNLEPVQMVIPKPKDPGTGITLGSLDIDILSELSENNSVASLDFSSTESESDRPQVTGAVMKPLLQAKSSTVGHAHGKVTVSEQSTASGSARPAGTTIVTVNGSGDHSIVIETHKHSSRAETAQRSDATLDNTFVLTPAPRREPQKPLIGPRAKATFDGKVVMENIEEIKNNNIHQMLMRSSGNSADIDRQSPQGRSSNVAYDEFSVRAFQEETLQMFEECLEFRDRIDTTGTSNSFPSFTEEELDVPTSVSTEFSFRRSPEGCSSSAEPQSQINAYSTNLTKTYIDKSLLSPETLLLTAKQPREKRLQLKELNQNEQQLQKCRQNIIISDHQHDHDIRSSVDSCTAVDAPLPTQKIRAVLQQKEAAPTMTTEREEIAVSASISSGRGSTASTDSASSVQSYGLTNRESASASRLSETSLDQDRSISAEPSCHDDHHSAAAAAAATIVIQQRSSGPYSSNSIAEERARLTSASEQPQTTVDLRRASYKAAALEEAATADSAGTLRKATNDNRNTGDNAAAAVTATGAVKSGVPSIVKHFEQPHIEKNSELDRDQDIYCVAPTSKLEVTRRPTICSVESSESSSALLGLRKSMSIESDVEQRVQRFQSSTLPNPKRRSGALERAQRGPVSPMPAKRNLLNMSSSQQKVDIFASPAESSNFPSSAVDTIPVPKNRRCFTQVFPRPPPAGHAPEPIAECPDLSGVVLLKAARGSFGVQIYPTPVPQPRRRRSTGGAEGTCETFSRRVFARVESSRAPQDVDITPMKKTVIEQDLQDKLPSVKCLASRFCEPVRPGDFQSSTLPTPGRRRKENARKKDDDLARRLSQFDSYT